jgi:hydrogenase nickel incorporation protein HypA/HybF
MHELSITEGILKVVVNEAEKHKVKKVSVIKVKIGRLSDLMPDCINYYFDVISKGTIAEGAVIDIEKIPAKAECSDCGFLSNVDIRNFRCEKCGSQKLKIVQGNEFYIDSMEVD